MSLNIKNPETVRLAHELAELTEETVTRAVTISIRERLERLRRIEQADLTERLLEIGRDTAARLIGEARTIDHEDLLYDESGLPG